MKEKVTIHEFLEIYARRITAIGIPVIITLIIDSILTRVKEEKTGSATLNRNFADTMNTGTTSIPVSWAIYIAIFFIVAIIAVTAVLLLCYWYNCTKAIYVWMIIAVGLLLSYYVYLAVGTFPGLFNLSVDWITVAIFLLNLVIVGVMSIFWRAPAIVTQAFMIVISVLTSLVFLSLPDWTVWILLVLLIFYDATVVLCPMGLLNLILKKTEERGDALPALIYSSAAFIWKEHDEEGGEENHEDDVYELEENQEFGEFEENDSESNSDSGSGSGDGAKIEEDVKTPINVIAEEEESNELDEFAIPNQPPKEEQKPKEEEKPENAENAPNSEEKKRGMPTNNQRRKNRPVKPKQQANTTKNETSTTKKVKKISKKEGVKLGLGDFIFYGILVTRAARIGWDICMLCILAVILGLSLTLVCLAIFERPLPALPFSLFLGIIFYIIGAMTFRPFSLNCRNDILVF